MLLVCHVRNNKSYRAIHIGLIIQLIKLRETDNLLLTAGPASLVITRHAGYRIGVGHRSLQSADRYQSEVDF